MSLPKDIDADLKFKRLEYLAFRGRWDTGEQDRLARILGLTRGARDDDGLCDYDRRLSSLETIYSFLTEYKDYDAIRQDTVLMIRQYVTSYPASEDNLPSNLHRRVFSKKAERLETELKEREGKQ